MTGPATPDQIEAMVALVARVAGRGRARVLVVARRGPHRRRRSAGAVPRRRSPTSSSRSPRVARDHPGHDARVHRRHGRDPRPSASSSWPTCRSPPTVRSTGTCSAACHPPRSTSSSSRRATAAAERGATVVALALPDLLRMRGGRMLAGLPGWGDVLRRSAEDRRAAIADPDVRARLPSRGERGRRAGAGGRDASWNWSRWPKRPDPSPRRSSAAPSPSWPPSGAPTPSTCCSTSWSPTTSR